jgi:hypothetical protein
METEHLSFYHGTGTDAAEAILKFGSRDDYLEDIGAFELGQLILSALRHHAGINERDDINLHSAFSDLPGAEYSVLWASAFKNLNGAGRTHFEYGHFYATLNIGNAYRYALSPYRSEFMLAIAEGMKLLQHLGDSLPEALPDKYPKIARAIMNPSTPVVIELRQISSTRLQTDNGNSQLQDELTLFNAMQEFEGLSAPLAFRIRDVAPSDIVAIHDLSDWKREDIGDIGWRPTEAQIKEVRQSPSCWRACVPARGAMP